MKSQVHGLSPHRGRVLIKVSSAFIRFFRRERTCYRDSYDYTRLLQQCDRPENLKKIHAQIVTSGNEQNPFVAAKLVSKYVEQGPSHMEDARRVFEGVSEGDVLLWNVVIRGYANSGPFEEAINVYVQMQINGICPNRYTFPFLLKACAAVEDGRAGQKIHAHVLRYGLESDLHVGNSLVAFYAKCGEIKVARLLFDEMPEKDHVSWNSMIAGYSQNERLSEALALFHQMVQSNSMNVLDRVTLVIVLPVCAQLAAIQEGLWIHSYIVKLGMEIDVVLGSGLVGMYAKCGHLETARQVFDRMLEKNIIVWNAMIGGYGMHGYADEALVMFYQMLEMGVVPDDISFVCVLSACSHAGMVDTGLELFERMGEYNVKSSEGHYACIVDLLGRAGKLDEAVEVIKSMPINAGKDVLGALLGACRIHNNIELADEVAKRLFVLDPENAGRYVLMAKMYEDAGRLVDAARVRRMMKERKVKKPLGCSVVEVDRVMHMFGVEDESHPLTREIYHTLENLEVVMEVEGGRTLWASH